ncbi:MAG: D-aminoacyl-tRNA deacylase [Desulfocapsaceae bacterium]|nr:D-aminoacyl-tRNA deacylase [Desulfocapsaceae bacterium]
MRSVVQRVSRARVMIDGEPVGTIGPGLVVLLGIHTDDSEKEAQRLADKIIHLRIFEDEKGLMNRSLLDVGGEMLIVSQFTLYGDCRKGRRPGYSSAARPEKAEPLYRSFIGMVQQAGIRTATGRFQAMMEVELVNDGPVTLLLDSAGNF